MIPDPCTTVAFTGHRTYCGEAAAALAAAIRGLHAHGFRTFLCGMSCLAGADTVQDHQPFFGYGRLHAGRFADNGECDRRKVGKSAFQPVLAGNFFFA